MENLELNEVGVVQSPYLHDATLISMELDEGDVSFLLRAPTGKIIRLLLRGVRGLSGNNIYESNVMFEVRVTPVVDANQEEFCRVLHFPSGTKIPDAQIARFRGDHLIFVQIYPTLGADVLALCQEIKWSYK